jgi:hypothetical protein
MSRAVVGAEAPARIGRDAPTYRVERSRPRETTRADIAVTRQRGSEAGVYDDPRQYAIRLAGCRRM